MYKPTGRQIDLHLSSAYVPVIGTNYDTCHFHNSFPESVGLNNIYLVRLKSASVPNMFPNVYSANNKLYYSTDNYVTINSITVADGFYSSASLASALTTAGSSINLAVSVDSATDKLRFTYSGSGTLSILGYAKIQARVEETSTQNELTGVGIGDIELTTSTTQVLAADPPALWGPQEVFIECTTLAHNHSIFPGGLQRSIIGTISLHDVPYGSLAHRDFEERANNEICQRALELASNIDVRLVDRYNNQLSLPPNCHPHIVLVIAEQADTF